MQGTNTIILSAQSVREMLNRYLYDHGSLYHTIRPALVKRYRAITQGAHKGSIEVVVDCTDDPDYQE